MTTNNITIKLEKNLHKELKLLMIDKNTMIQNLIMESINEKNNRQ